MKDYMGIPDEIETIGKIYHVGILEWDIFQPLAYKYMMFSKDFIKYKLKITDENFRVFDYLTLLILAQKDANERLNMLSELETLFSIIVKSSVKGFVNNKSGEFFFTIGENGRRINRDNYDDFREIVFRQNLLFDPVIAPNEFSQKYIDNAIKVLSRGGQPVDIEAMVVYVSNAKKIHPCELKNYTYYQLRADCEMEMRKEMNRDINLFRSQGSSVDPVNLLESLNIHKNPYGKDVLFNKMTKGGENKLEKMMKV